MKWLVVSLIFLIVAGLAHVADARHLVADLLEVWRPYRDQ